MLLREPCIFLRELLHISLKCSFLASQVPTFLCRRALFCVSRELTRVTSSVMASWSAKRRASVIALRRLWFGTSWSLASCSFVHGELSLPCLNQSWMAPRL